MTQPQNALPIGYRLQGPQYEYVIERVLGHGGFGITYLVSAQVKVGKVSGRFYFALKEHFLGGDCEREVDTNRVVYSNPVRQRVEGSCKDFIAEARRLNSVSHPNIVQVNEVFEANNTAYYVMEYLEGQSLRQYVSSKGALTEAEMLSVMMPIVNAVKALHQQRLTHLDIKPANIMLTKGVDGNVRPVLIDFGLSKHYDSSGQATSTVNTMGFSEGYAPIEQYAGITTFSPTADYYALGATMWYCLTGRDPQKSTLLRPGELVEALPANISATTRQMIADATMLTFYNRTLGEAFVQPPSFGTRVITKAPGSNINSRIPPKYKYGIIAAIVAVILGIFFLVKAACKTDVDKAVEVYTEAGERLREINNDSTITLRGLKTYEAYFSLYKGLAPLAESTRTINEADLDRLTDAIANYRSIDYGLDYLLHKEDLKQELKECKTVGEIIAKDMPDLVVEEDIDLSLFWGLMSSAYSDYYYFPDDRREIADIVERYIDALQRSTEIFPENEKKEIANMVHQFLFYTFSINQYDQIHEEISRCKTVGDLASTDCVREIIDCLKNMLDVEIVEDHMAKPAVAIDSDSLYYAD